jgi:hypothetical protein
LFFMALGGFFGLLEEVIPLVPIMIALAYSLGWDSLTGLGMSIWRPMWGFRRRCSISLRLGSPNSWRVCPCFRVGSRA